MSGVTVRSKIEHGIIFGALHRVIQDSHLENLDSFARTESTTLSDRWGLR